MAISLINNFKPCLREVLAQHHAVGVRQHLVLHEVVELPHLDHNLLVLPSYQGRFCPCFYGESDHNQKQTGFTITIRIASERN